MGKIKLILTDIDGTIVMPGKHEVSQKVRNVIIAAEKKGISVVPVTGRPFEMAQNVMDLLGFDGLCVVDGGATIRKVITGELVWSKWISVETIRKVVPVMLPYCAKYIDYFPIQKEVDPKLVRVEDIAEAAPYIFAPVHDDLVDELMDRLVVIPGIAVYANPRFEGSAKVTGIQVTDIAADKYHGVGKLLEIIGVHKDQVMGIGDSNNDLPLFKSAGLKVAMGNATEKLKAEADQIVCDVEGDGFAEAVELFVLI